MYLFRGTLTKLAVPMILAVSLVAGSVNALAFTPTPTDGNAIAMQTYGVLPTIVLNLTQSPINLTISNATNGICSSQNGSPSAAGWSGLYYYNNSGVTPTIANIMPASSSPYSLMPVITSVAPTAQTSGIKGAVAAIDTFTWNKNNSYLNLFSLFPAFDCPGVRYPMTQWVAMSNLNNNQGALPGSDATVLGGWLDQDVGNINIPPNTANGLGLATPSTTTLQMNHLTNGLTTPFATYYINIDSLGAGTSAYTAPPKTSLLDTLNTILNVIVDVTTLIAFDDPVALTAIATGIVSTIDGMSDKMSNPAATANLAYPASNKGISVSATASFGRAGRAGGGVQPWNLDLPANTTQPYPDSLTYQVGGQWGDVYTLPLEQQNTVLVATYRQYPGNTGTFELGSADTLIVVVLNEGVYAANQVQQYINSRHSPQKSSTAKYTPTKEQAQDSAKILAILHAIAKNNPQDAKTIVEIFGVHGTYKHLKQDPSAMSKLHTDVKAIFEKHSKALPAIGPYLARLAQP